jgi:hypothetical protein
VLTLTVLGKNRFNSERCVQCEGLENLEVCRVLAPKVPLQNSSAARKEFFRRKNIFRRGGGRTGRCVAED